VKAGSQSDTPVIGSDIFSTICDIVNIPLPQDRTIDGASILPVFDNQPIQREQPLYWRNHLAPENSRVAMRVDDWKILASENLTKFELYNIQEDWQETDDLRLKHPVKFEELKKQLIQMDAAVLAEGPDWWKEDKSRSRKTTKTVNPPPGTDSTGHFQQVNGVSVAACDLGYRLKATGEGLALRKLDSPIVGRAVLSTTYRSNQKKGKIRNAAIVFGTDSSNQQTLKIGTAIGMNQHVAFSGGWQNVGELAKVNADFEPLDTFQIQVEVDLDRHLAITKINGKTMEVALPAAWKEISWIGFYVKATESDFADFKIELE
jgi:arylsulfatase A